MTTSQSPSEPAMAAARAPLYYSYDPEDGIRFHATPEEAIARAEKAKDDAEFNAADSDWVWMENEEDISWGEVRGKIAYNDSPLTPEDKAENPDFDFNRTLSMDDYPERHFQPLLAKVEKENDVRAKDQLKITNQYDEAKRVIGGVRHENERLRGVERQLRTELAAKEAALKQAERRFSRIACGELSGMAAKHCAKSGEAELSAALKASTPTT